MITVAKQKSQGTEPTKVYEPSLLAALDRACGDSVNLLSKPLPAFEVEGKEFRIPRYLFVGPRGGAEPIRVGLFAGMHGTEPEGVAAMAEFTLALEQKPELARNYVLFVYPMVNPSGFSAGTRTTMSGVSIANELWRNSTSPEVQQIQSELWMHAFDGIVSLKTDPLASELLIEVGGPIFARHVFGQGLAEAQDILPQSVSAGREALRRLKASLLEKANEIIRAAPGVKPRPFEIVITIPGNAASLQQRTAVALLLQRTLSDYRDFISFGANL